MTEAESEFAMAYAESMTNSFLAAQIRIIRCQRGLTQKALAERCGTKQPGIARLEDVNYDRWSVPMLRKIARALGVRLKITFEDLESYKSDMDDFTPEGLRRPR